MIETLLRLNEKALRGLELSMISKGNRRIKKWRNVFWKNKHKMVELSGMDIPVLRKDGSDPFEDPRVLWAFSKVIKA